MLRTLTGTSAVLPTTGTFAFLSPAVSWALQSLSSCQSSLEAQFHFFGSPPWGCRAVQTSSSAGGNGALTRPSPAASSSLPAPVLSHGSPLLLDGSRGADPGEPRYTAPYWIPAEVLKANHLPQVLFTDPWNPHDEPGIRRHHARLCYDILLQSPSPLTAEQVRDAVNDHLRELHQEHRAASDDSFLTPPPLLATTAYVKQLLEHMRRTRLLYGKKNPDSSLSAGHPEHPRLYLALRYQAERFGNPAQLAEEAAARKAKRIQQAFKRLRHGKPPFAIHRR